MARLSKVRPGPVAVMVTLMELWKRLPPQQRKQLLTLARKHGPTVMAKARARRR